MEFRILGPLEVSESGMPVALGAPKQHALLAVLLLHANEVVSRERLIDELWGESPPARATKLVQQYVSGLRKVLPEGVLLTRAPGYLLRVEPGRLDLSEFERLLEDARRAEAEGKLERAADLHRHALSLWRGPALADVALESSDGREADRLDELRLTALLERLELELELGRHAQLAAELEALVARYPYQERLSRQLMLALYRSGRQAEALAVYTDTRRRLIDELGLEPSQELQRLERAILQQDAALELPRAAAPGVSAEEPPPAPRRKTVTAVICVLATSPSDPEALRNAISRAAAALRAAAEYHGGTAERLAGGELMAVFGAGEAHEDDALRALRTAERVRSAELRIGVATGTVLAEGMVVTGEAVGTASRLAAVAAPGQVLAAGSTLTLAGSAVEADGSRVLAVAEGRPAFPDRSEAPMVGRREELARLQDLFAALVEDGHCRVTTVFGEAGIGKTRLARELVAALGDESMVLVGRCVSYGEGATYLPLRGAFRDVDVAAVLAGSDDAQLVAQRVAELTGEAEGSSSSGEGFWAVRRLLEALARERPLLLVLEDVHWAEPTLLDLVEYVAEWSTEARILVLCLARPELLDNRPAWAGPTSPVVSISLEPLSADDSELLVAALAGNIGPEARVRIAETAEGNPLYAEQLIAYAEDEGEHALSDVPPTIDALLASRLDRLGAGERSALERAAVVGREFSHGAVVHLSPPEEAGSLGRHLLALTRRGLVRPGGSQAPPGDAYRFHHVLVRDVAYAAISKELRAELHEHHADQLELDAADDALVGHHLEQAYRLRTDLGERDGHALRLAVSAGERLGAAGLRAWHVGDAPAATNLLERAAGLLPPGHWRRAETIRELGWSLWAAGDGERADAAFAESVDTAAASADRRSELRARLDLAYRSLFADPEGGAEDVLELAAEAVPVFETLGDHHSLGWAWLAVAHIHGGWQGQYGVAVGDLDRALTHYRAHRWVAPMCLRELAMALYFGPTPVEAAAERCAGLLEETGRLAAADVGIYLAGLQAMRGRVHDARHLAAQTRATYKEIAPISILAIWAPVAAEIELLAGDRSAAAHILEDACVALEGRGDSVLLSERAGLLAGVLCAQGRVEDAEHWARLAEEAAARGDIGAHVRWRAARAAILASRGALTEAEAIAREAVRLAEGTDRLCLRADVLLALAEVLRLDGGATEAALHVEEAIWLYGEKGNVAAIGSARALLKDPAPA